MAYKVILDPDKGQFRQFESPRVRTRINFRWIFSCALIDLRKARERELATLDENRRSVGAESYALKRSKAITGRGEGTTPAITACPEAGKLKYEKIKLTSREDQSAISSQEHVKYEAIQTYLLVPYQHDRLH